MGCDVASAFARFLVLACFACPFATRYLCNTSFNNGMCTMSRGVVQDHHIGTSKVHKLLGDIWNAPVSDWKHMRHLWRHKLFNLFHTDTFVGVHLL